MVDILTKRGWAICMVRGATGHIVLSCPGSGDFYYISVRGTIRRSPYLDESQRCDDLEKELMQHVTIQPRRKAA